MGKGVREARPTAWVSPDHAVGLVVRGIFGIFRDFVLLYLFLLWFFAIDDVLNKYWVL
jgi:hypothetical protein